MPLDYFYEDDYFEEDFSDELDDESVYFDQNEDMDKYYDFNLLDILEDVDLEAQDLKSDELNNYLSKGKKI